MRKRIRIGCIAALVAVLLLAALDSRLVIREYVIEAPEIASPIRIALVTDLHSCRYGENQRTLIDAVRGQDPDVVLLGGDIFDDVIDDANAETFIAGIAEHYPCYYVTGNHEYWSGAEGFAQKTAILDRYNIPALSGESRRLKIGKETIILCGVDDLAGVGEVAFLQQLDAVNEATGDGGFTVLLSHRPEYWEKYRKSNFDLILCGHAHGGQWRIPGLLNGLFAPNQGLFPQYAGGIYEHDDKTMVVSRGLARESTRVPRIFNRPELVIVELR